MELHKMKNSITASALFFLLSATPTLAAEQVIINGQQGYDIEKLNTVLKNSHTPVAIGMEMLKTLNKATTNPLFSASHLQSKGVQIEFAASGGPLSHINNPNQIVIDNIELKGNQLSFILTVHTDQMFGIAQYTFTRAPSQQTINFFKKNLGQTIIIRT